MRKIEVNGLGVLVEIWNRKEDMNELETMKEAVKALQREILRRQGHEANTNHHANRPLNDD